MYLEESPYQRDQLINIDQLIGRALDHGIDLGDNHHQTLENYVNSGLVPRLLNGEFPATALDRLIAIDKMQKEGLSVEQIKKILEDERKSFLKKPMGLSSLVDAYKGASKSLLMLGTVVLFLFFGASLFISLPQSSLKKGISQPVGRVLAQFIKEAKPANSTSTDPLGLTNVSKVITINEKHEVTIQKTITADSSPTNKAANNSLVTNDSLSIDSIDVKKIISKDISFPNLKGATGACVLTLDIAQVLSCSQDQIQKATTIKDTTFIAGAGLTITPNDAAKTITFSLAGSGINANLLNSINSTQFLRSDISTNFTSGTLTLNAGTTLNVLGTFTCTSCVTDSAVSDTLTVGAASSVAAGAINSGTLGNPGVTLALGSFGSITGVLADANVSDTITASNYLPLAGGTMGGNVNFNNNLALNLGNAGTNFTAGGGLNIATNLSVSGNSSLGNNVVGLPANYIINAGHNFTGSGTFTGESLNAFYTGVDTFTILRGLTVNSDWQSGAGANAFEVSGVSVQANQMAATPITSLSALVASVGSSGSGAITTATGLGLSKNWISAVPTTTYGINLGNFGNAGTTTSYGLYLANQTGSTTTYSIYSAGGLNYFSGAITASAGSTSAVGFNLNTAQAGPSCASLTNGDFGFDSTNNRIFWKGTGGICSYWNRTGTFDIAERAIAGENLKNGDLLAIDTTSSEFKVKKSSSPYQKTLLGIQSTDPSFIDNPDTLGNPTHLAKIALAGRVPTKVSTENGPIEVGDYLTSSSIAGVAMKATESGPVIGKALQNFNQPGVGKVLVLVNSSFYTKPISGTENSTITTQSILLGSNQIKLNLLGELVIAGTISITGDVRISKTLYANKIETNQLKVSKLNLDSSSDTSGSATIPAGITKVVIPTSSVTSASRILVTPNNFTNNQVLVVTKKFSGNSFTVEVQQPINHPISFDWWVVN